MESNEPECRHGMNPEWCADCLGHKDAEEEERNDTSAFLRNLQGLYEKGAS